MWEPADRRHVDDNAKPDATINTGEVWVFLFDLSRERAYHDGANWTVAFS
jgi:hypothetical protein